MDNTEYIENRKNKKLCIIIGIVRLTVIDAVGCGDIWQNSTMEIMGKTGPWRIYGIGGNISMNMKWFVVDDARAYQYIASSQEKLEIFPPFEPCLVQCR